MSARSISGPRLIARPPRARARRPGQAASSVGSCGREQALWPRAARRARACPRSPCLVRESQRRAAERRARSRRAVTSPPPRSLAQARRSARRFPAAATARRPRRPESLPTRASAAPRRCRGACRIASWPRSALVITSTSGISMIPRLQELQDVRRLPGWTTTATVSGDVGDLGLGLADADRLDHDDRRTPPRAREPRRASHHARPPRRSPAEVERMNTPRSRASKSIRARSPSSDRPERRELGSTASTATV